MVQLPLAGTVAFATEMEPEPAVAVMAGEPHPEEDALAGLATVMAPGVVGKVSEKLRSLIGTVAVLVRVKVRVDIPPIFVGDGLKLFEIFTALAGSTIYA
jgi:hypothetical protein